MPEKLITLRLKPDQLKSIINRLVEPDSIQEVVDDSDHWFHDAVEALVKALDMNPAGERLYTLEQILEVIRGTAIAEGLPLGISLLDVRAGFKLLDERLDAANGAG